MMLKIKYIFQGKKIFIFTFTKIFLKSTVFLYCIFYTILKTISNVLLLLLFFYFFSSISFLISFFFISRRVVLP